MRLRDTWPETGLMGRWGRWANQVARILNGAVGCGGAQVFVTPRGLEVYAAGTDPGFSGIAYVYGVRHECNEAPNLGFVVVNLNTGQVSESAGPMPVPMPPGEEWYAKAEERGPIRIANR